ncbi:MAG: MotA/TolQ/ExbB proton channel family protein [Bacteroidales bacterium]|nr:MotA/TolQ/ExbB proton channel family protein [Candidatus Cryptobacteroides caccocaballi]
MFTLLQADTLATAAAAEAVPQQELTLSLIDMCTKGGWLMIVLLLLSVIAIYLFAKKFWMIRRAANVDKKFLQEVRDLIHEGKIKAATKRCEEYDSPVARLVEKGIERIGRPLSDIQTAVENTANVEVQRLEKGLPYLAMISGGAPMIGFLGTVTGMIKAFFNMAQAGNNIDIALLSSGIYQAMVTTVGGLAVGIIAYFAYNYLTAKVSDVVFQMENSTIEFMDMLNEPAENK